MAGPFVFSMRFLLRSLFDFSCPGDATPVRDAAWCAAAVLRAVTETSLLVLQHRQKYKNISVHISLLPTINVKLNLPDINMNSNIILAVLTFYIIFT